MKDVDVIDVMSSFPSAPPARSGFGYHHYRYPQQHPSIHPKAIIISVPVCAKNRSAPKAAFSACEYRVTAATLLIYFSAQRHEVISFANKTGFRIWTGESQHLG